MAGRCTLGFASGNGAIGRMGHGIKEHAVVLVLSALDPFLFKLGGSKGGRFLDCPAADWRPPLISFRFISPFLSFGDAKQTVRSDAAFVLALCVWWMRGRIRWRDTLAFSHPPDAEGEREGQHHYGRFA